MTDKKKKPRGQVGASENFPKTVLNFCEIDRATKIGTEQGDTHA